MGKSKSLENSLPLDRQPLQQSLSSELDNDGPSTSFAHAGLASSVHSLASSSSDSETETPSTFHKKVQKAKYLDSGVKKLLLLALAPNTKECYENLKLILDALKVFEVEGDFTIASDMKLFAILLGIQPASSTFPCLWCEGEKHEYAPDAPLRTLGSCRENAQKFKDAVALAEQKGRKAPLHCLENSNVAKIFCFSQD